MIDINKSCLDWDKADWTEAYAEYNKTQLYGPKTKREYYDMVMANHKKLHKNEEPLSDELKEKWTAGWRWAVSFAKTHRCDHDGVEIIRHKDTSAEALERAKLAEEIALSTAQKVDFMERK